MGPVSEKAMVWKIHMSVITKLVNCFPLPSILLKDYSMDCYFRQYWRDKRLSFSSPIKKLSLSIKVRI